MFCFNRCPTKENKGLLKGREIGHQCFRTNVRGMRRNNRDMLGKSIDNEGQVSHLVKM